MARWVEFEKDAPEFAARVRAVLDRHKHKTMATVRRSGAPRISGAEIHFAGGVVFRGAMPGARKGADLRRDPRVAFHSQSEDADESDPGSWPGDAKCSGRAVLVTDPEELAAFWAAYGKPDPAPEPDGCDLFRIVVEDVVQVRIEPPDMVIESWHERGGYRRRARS